jgi:hypothetical protein
MGKVKQSSTCYYCGVSEISEKLTKEHTPPHGLFTHLPKGTAYYANKVPSCAIHNNEKSIDDQAIMKGFYVGMLNKYAQMKEYAPGDSILSWVKGNTKILNHTRQQTAILPLYLNDDLNLVSTEIVAHIRVNEQTWIRSITAGLLFGLCDEKLKSADFDSAIVIAWDTIDQERSMPLTKDQRTLHVAKRHRRYQLLQPRFWLPARYGRHIMLPMERYTYRVSILPDSLLFEHCFLLSYKYWCKVRLNNEDLKMFTHKFSELQLYHERVDKLVQRKTTM